MKTVHQGDRLRIKIKLAQPVLNVATYNFWKSPDLELLFPDYLFALYCSMSGSVPLMETAYRRAVTLAPHDPVAAEIAPYYARHAEEEREHANWMLDDMESWNIKRNDILERIPLPEVATLIGSQYYWVLHVHPVALMAYFAVLERPLDKSTIANHIRGKNIPATALRTLYLHCEDDVEHHAEVFDLLNQLPLSQRQTELIGINAIRLTVQLAHLFESLTNRSS